VAIGEKAGVNGEQAKRAGCGLAANAIPTGRSENNGEEKGKPLHFIQNREGIQATMRKGKAKLLKSEMVFRGKVFGVRRDQVVEPGGVHATREVVTHSGSVVVLPVFKDGKVLLIRQYRHATRQYLWELVAGRIDQGESVKKAGARELKEETGYTAKRFSEFLDFFPTPGFLEERMHLLLAEGLEAGKAQPEADEKIISHAYTVEELKQMMRKGKLRDGKSIAGLLYYMSFVKFAWNSKQKRG